MNTLGNLKYDTSETGISQFPVAMFSVVRDLSQNWELAYISNGVLELVGCHPVEVESWGIDNWMKMVCPEYVGLFYQTVKKCLTEERPQNFMFKVRKSNRREIWVWSKVEGTILPNGQAKVNGFLTDISDLKRGRRKHLFEKNNEISEDQIRFLQNLSHEIRTPMNAILDFSNRLMQDVSGDQKQHVSNIKQNSFQLLNIVNDILDISAFDINQDELEEHEFNLNHLFDDMHVMFSGKCKEKGLAFFMLKPLLDSEAKIITDELKLIKILSKLLENAVKFTEQGFIELSYQKLDTSIEITVRDTGIGMASSETDKVFRRFYQVNQPLGDHKGGLGLGLAIVDELVCAIGARIRVISRDGLGTEFIITLPLK